jgi:phosphonate transport system substrate-binding protein
MSSVLSTLQIVLDMLPSTSPQIDQPLSRRHCLRTLGQGALALSTLSLSDAFAQAPAVNNYKIGVLPNVSARMLLQLYQPVRQYVERVRGTPVEILTAPDFMQFYRRTIAGQYDLVITGAHMGRLANVDHGHGVVGLFTPDMKCLMVTLTSRPLANVQELKGQSISFANSASIVAIAGIRWLGSQQLKVGSDVTVAPVFGDDSIANKLTRGDVRAAFMSMGEFRSIPEEVRKTFSIHTTFLEVPAFMVMKPTDMRLKAPAALADFEVLRKEWSEFPKTAEAKTYASLTGTTGVIIPKSEDLARLDGYIDDTRRLVGLA